jgi:hypothetical protein
MPYAYVGPDLVWKSEEDREVTRPSGLRVVTSTFQGRASSVDKVVREAKTARGGLFPFTDPELRFRGGFVFAEITYYGIAPGRENNPHIERGREDGTVLIKRWTTRQLAIPPQPGEPGKLASVSSVASSGFNFPAMVPTIRYSYAKRADAPYIKFSIPNPSASEIEIKEARRLGPGRTRTYQEPYIGFWQQTDLQETNHGQIIEVQETWKFTSTLVIV